MPGNELDSLEVPTFNISIIDTFCTLWKQTWLPGSAHIQRSYSVSHALKEMLGNNVDSIAVPTFNAFIVFYTLWDNAG